MTPDRPAWAYRRVLLGVLLVAAIVRVLYVVAQPAVDPTYDAPQLDGAEYVALAREILAGGDGGDGAYYLAPGYPMLLAGLFALFAGSFTALYLIQHGCVLVAAAALATVARRVGGTAAGLACAVLAVTYGPLLFFASRPLGEVVAIALLALAIAFASGPRRRWPSGGIAGALAGAAALARPNFAAAAVLWAVGGSRRRVTWTLAILVGLAAAIVPVTVRNARVSGHLVPISANSGLTLYHGNGPDASGAYTPVAGMTGSVAVQREEAVRLARAISKDPSLDPVQADRWWRRQAIAARAADPAGTVVLGVRRALLTAGGREIGVDESPRIDDNVWRYAAPVPFAALFALACAGVVARGWRGTGGTVVWGAVAATAAAPLVFYVSTRYRLPLAAVLTVPAGVGAASLFEEARERWRGGRRATLAAAVSLLLPVLVPDGLLLRSADAVALANRAAAWSQRGDLSRAERDLRRGLELDPASGAAWYNLGVVLERAGRGDAAIDAYGRTLAVDPGHGQAGANLGALYIRAGRPDLAVAPLERAVRARPDLRPGWSNLVVARLAIGDVDGARRTAGAASSGGVVLDPDLLALIPPAGATGQ